MHLLDPYGLGHSTPTEPAADSREDLTTPGHDAEVELAANAPHVDVQVPGDTASSSDLDAAMRFQDAPSNWAGSDGGQAAPDEAPADPAAVPYAPLQEGGDQGI